MKLFKGLSCVPLVVLICVLVLKDVEAASLTISPSQNLAAGATTLTLRCSPVSNTFYNVLYSVQINKRTLVQNSQETLMASIDGTGTTVGTGITTPTYTVTGNYVITEQPTQAFLQIVIADPDCNHAVEYQCITNGQPTVASDSATLQEAKNVTVQTNPGAITITRFQEKIQYDIGENIEITCQGDVGTPEKFWSWESKSVGDSFFSRITENITQGTVEAPTSTRCGYYSRNILNYYIGQGDNGLEIRCKVDNSDLYSANKTFYLKNTDTGNPGENTGDDKPDNAGMIAGIVVAVIVVIVIVIVVIVVVLKRRKNTAGKDYDTQEDRMKSQTNAHMPPDTQEHDQKQNNEFRGRVNKSMEDSPDDQDRRRPYTITTNGGRTNPGMDNSFDSDDAPRDPYLAQDGTDIRGSNAMLGSAV